MVPPFRYEGVGNSLKVGKILTGGVFFFFVGSWEANKFGSQNSKIFSKSRPNFKMGVIPLLGTAHLENFGRGEDPKIPKIRGSPWFPHCLFLPTLNFGATLPRTTVHTWGKAWGVFEFSPHPQASFGVSTSHRKTVDLSTKSGGPTQVRGIIVLSVPGFFCLKDTAAASAAIVGSLWEQ